MSVSAETGIPYRDLVDMDDDGTLLATYVHYLNNRGRNDGQVPLR